MDEFVVKISDSGWLCVKHNQQWLPTFKLTDEQSLDLSETLTMITALNNAKQENKDEPCK